MLTPILVALFSLAPTPSVYHYPVETCTACNAKSLPSDMKKLGSGVSKNRSKFFIESTDWNVRPRNLSELLDFLTRNLNGDFKSGLIYYYGFEIATPQIIPYKSQLNLEQLEELLFREFELTNSKNLLGQQVFCVSPGERDLTAIFAQVVDRLMHSSNDYRPRSDIPKNYANSASLDVSYRIISLCSRMQLR